MNTSGSWRFTAQTSRKRFVCPRGYFGCEDPDRPAPRDIEYRKILTDYARDCTTTTSLGHCSRDNIRAGVIPKLRSRDATFPSIRLHPSGRRASTIIVSLAIVYQRLRRYARLVTLFRRVASTWQDVSTRTMDLATETKVKNVREAK